MSRQKDIRRALMLAQTPESEMVARRLQELAMSPGVTDLLNASKAEPAFADGEKKSRTGFAYGGAPFEFTPFVAPQYDAITHATIQPGAIAPPRPPDPPALPWPTPTADVLGRRGRLGRDLAEQIASKGMGPVPGASAWGAPDGGGAGNTTANTFGGSYAGTPGIMGLVGSMYNGQDPTAAQVGQALASLATGVPGLAIGALGYGLNQLGFSPSTNPHGVTAPDIVDDDTGLGVSAAGIAAAAQAADVAASEAAADSAAAGTSGVGAAGSPGDAGNGAQGPGEARGGRIDHGQHPAAFIPGIHVRVPLTRAARADGGPAPDPEPEGIVGYHGTPHDFPAERLIQHPTGEQEHIQGAPGALPDVPQGAQVLRDYPHGRFRDAAIGSGEGAQAYGHGHYLAQREGVARDYQQQVRDMVKYNASQKRRTEITREMERLVVPGSYESAHPDYYKEFINPKGYELAKELAQLMSEKRPSGKLYQVRIRAHPEHFLDWDKPLSEQHPEVLSKIKNIQSLDKVYHVTKNPTGGSFWRYLDNEAGKNLKPANAASMALHAAGIPGIRYLDGVSRGHGEGTHNYVVFDPAMIDIEKKYAQGGGVDPDEGPVNDPQRQLTPLGMYSHAAETARALPQAQDTREGMISALTARGVRANEMQQSGVREAFPPGKVTKDQLVGHFQQALPPLQETINGPVSGRVKYRGYTMTEDGQPRRQLGRRPMPVPGYREILLHLPEIHGGGVEKTAEKNRHIAAEAAAMAAHSGDINHVDDWGTAPQEIKDLHLEEARNAFTDNMQESIPFRQIFTVPGTEPNFWGDHWPTPNVVAHIRVQDRKDLTGKKVLHLEELQSDWGQALRQQARHGLANPSEHPAPAGPYVGKTEDWTDLGLKRALIEAARGGHDKLVWTPGNVQNARYDLVAPEGGEAMPDDMRRAAEGMRRYYDQMLPQRLRAITKGLDPSAQIGQHDMGKMGKLPGIDITPRMRAAILRGLPAYQRGGLIQDKYPTHYMPSVGRQVMKTGGELVNSLEEHQDPESKRMAGWNWTPLPQVHESLGSFKEIPSHVAAFGNFMNETAKKAATSGLTSRDLIKAYAITRASIQREGRRPEKVLEHWPEYPGPRDKIIRPEGAMGEWLQTAMGQRYLDSAVKGNVDHDAVQDAVRAMGSFGMTNKGEAQALPYAAQMLPGQEGRVSDMVARAIHSDSAPQEWRDWATKLHGIKYAKSGFLASMLGRGDQPTADARQYNAHSGMPPGEARNKLIDKAQVDSVLRLAKRQTAMNIGMPSELAPHYQHLVHHTVWDKVGNDVTTHDDLMNAMRHAASGGAIGEAPIHQHILAHGMRRAGILGLGRQVMADGGTIDPDTDQPREFNPSRIFALAAGGLVDRALQIIRTKAPAMSTLARNPASVLAVPTLNRKAFSV